MAVKTSLGTPFQAGGLIGNTTFAATQSGPWSVTANAGTNLNTSALALETGGNLASAATVLGTTADVAYTGTGSGTHTSLLKWIGAQTVAAAASLSQIYTKLSSSIAVTGTFWQATQPISAASLPLPTGAATSANQAAINADGGAQSHVMNFPSTQVVSGTVTLGAGTNQLGSVSPSNDGNTYTATTSTTGAQTLLSFTAAQLVGIQTLYVQFTNMGAGGAVEFDASSNGGATWTPVPASYNNLGSSTGLPFATNVMYQVPVQGNAMRIQLTTLTGGTVSVLVTTKAGNYVVNPQGASVGVTALPATTVKVVQTPTVTATTYALGKVLGGIMTFASILPATSFAGLLESITIKFKGSVQTGGFYVAVFSTSPTGTFTDSNTAVIASTDSALLVGLYHLVSPNSPLGSHTIYNLDGIAKAFTGSSTSLYAVIVPDATTVALASASDMIVELAVMQG